MVWVVRLMCRSGMRRTSMTLFSTRSGYTNSRFASSMTRLRMPIRQCAVRGRLQHCAVWRQRSSRDSARRAERRCRRLNVFCVRNADKQIAVRLLGFGVMRGRRFGCQHRIQISETTDYGQSKQRKNGQTGSEELSNPAHGYAPVGNRKPLHDDKEDRPKADHQHRKERKQVRKREALRITQVACNTENRAEGANACCKLPGRRPGATCLYRKLFFGVLYTDMTGCARHWI
jgi:hypothetical protein